MNVQAPTVRNAKPFLKWAGGKTQLLPTIEQRLPPILKNEKEITYIEPFVGGGALLFFMLRNYRNIKKAVINDINIHLINAYKAIRDTPSELIAALSNIQETYAKLPNLNSKKEYFLDIRKKFNNENLGRVDDAALLIFLNRTCFNGLYRENSKGEFNVPFGQYYNPLICDENTILANNELLQNVLILNGDFSQTMEYAGENTFVYLDPPYRPLDATSCFNSYSKEPFDDNEQIRLKVFIDSLDKKGCRIMLSNSDGHSRNENDVFFDHLYSKYLIERVSASRAINANPTKRGKLSELLIRNYDGETVPTNNCTRMENNSIDNFLKPLKETHFSLGDYVDFQKVEAHIESISMKLNQLNYLIGKEDMAAAVNRLWIENRNAFSVLGILIAVRQEDKKKVLDKNGNTCLIKDYLNSPELITEFLDSTGLTKILQSGQIKNLVDYVFGVEVGLDSNARKNRSGDIMENLVASIFKNSDIEFKKEVYSKEFPEIEAALGTDKKRFDFVIRTALKTYLIEVNYYSGSGSKLNEIARSYTDLCPKINAVSGYEFIWITDGIGWKNAKNKIEEALIHIPGVYNLTTIYDFINIVKS